VDYAGRIVRLAHVNWERHIPVHPEVVAYHDEIRRVLSDPGVVVETGDERHYYRGGVGTDKYRRVQLKVVVGASNGWIRTVHFARRMKLRNGQIVYQAPEQSEQP
jgi:hypothetical protein